MLTGLSAGSVHVYFLRITYKLSTPLHLYRDDIIFFLLRGEGREGLFSNSKSSSLLLLFHFLKDTAG